ncbi:MAG: hypothetical protein WCR95_05665 [Eubacteriales bacterium]
MRILPLENIDAELIVQWNNKKTADFLNQWAGRGYEYPITVKQITYRESAGLSIKRAMMRSLQKTCF